MLINKDTTYITALGRTAVLLLLIELVIMTGTGNKSYASNNRDLQEYTADPQQYMTLKKIASSDMIRKKRLISIEFDKTPLLSALQQLAREARVGISFNPDIIPDKKITLKVDNVLVDEVLYTLLKGTNLEITLPPSKDVLVIKRKRKKLLKVPAQGPAIEGQVTDAASNETLPGVNIVVKGTTIGTSSDRDGKYELNVPSLSDTLIFSFIGYSRQEIPINGRSTINIGMIQQALVSDEVVVTALGFQREKAALSYAVTEVKGESFAKAREINFGNALSGKIAGVNATSTATGPGGSSRVIIRGNGSLVGNNQPLYVIDGVPIDNTNIGSAGMWGGYDKGDGLNSINPDNIENISVLKGGTAAALYGSRASNGVILVTTKSGRAQEGIGVEFNSTYTNERPLVFSDWQNQYGSGTRGAVPTSQAEAIANGSSSWGGRLDGSMVIQPDGIERPYTAKGNNIKEFYNIGHTFSNTIAIDGGNELASFRFAASNMDNNGVIPNSSISRKTFSLNVNANLSEKIIFKGNAQYSIEDGANRPYVSDQPFNPNAAPMILSRNIDVRTLAPGYDERGYETIWHRGDANNPYFVVDKVKNSDQRRRLIGDFTARYNVTDFLYVRGRFGIDQNVLESESIIPTGINLWSTGMSSDRNNIYETNIEGIIGFNQSFGRFSIDALAGGNKMHHVVDVVNLSSGQFNIPFEYFIRNGTNQQFSQNFQEYATNSLFGSADIGYQDYLFLSLTGRQDWFSTLPSNSNSIFYPSVGLSFVFSDLWDSKPSWLSYGKIRASWAQVGGGTPDPYSLDLVYSAQSSPHLGQPLMGIGSSTVPNRSIKPYTSTTTEFGIELRGFDNRIGADVTLYERKTTNDIVSASISTATSYSNVLLNTGVVRNKGIEVTLDGTPIQQKSFTWNVSYNMAYNRNTVEKIAEGLNSLALPGGEVRTRNGFIYHFEGKPYGQVAGYKARTDENGNIVYNAATGLPVQSEFMPLGSGVAPVNLGLTNSFRYKSFSLSFLLDGKFGGKLYSATNAYATANGLATRTVENNAREDGVEVSGVDMQGQPYNATINAEDYYKGIALTITDEFVYDASFVKLRQITLGYSLPNSLISRTPFQSASLTLVGRNLLLLYSEVPNVDPESTYNNSNAQGLEMYGVPPARSFGINLSVRY